MANKAFSDLTAETTIAAGDLLAIETAGGNSRKVTAADAAKALHSLAPNYEAAPTAVPDLSGFATWRNQGTATATADAYGVYLGGDNDSELHIREMNIPATPFSYYARIRLKMNTTTVNTAAIEIGAGFAIINSTSGRVLTCSIAQNRVSSDEQNNYRNTLVRWSSVTAFNAVVTQIYDVSTVNWIRVDVTSTGVTLFCSVDGRRWIQVGSDTFASYLTATGGTADKFGIYMITTAMNVSDPTFAYFDVLQSTAP